jgi:hypothetical protein
VAARTLQRSGHIVLRAPGIDVPHRSGGGVALLIPNIGLCEPLLAGGTDLGDQPRFDARLVARELLPRLRAGGEYPSVGVARVDAGAGRQPQPAPLGCPVTPELESWTVREHAQAQGFAPGVGVQARVRKRSGQAFERALVARFAYIGKNSVEQIVTAEPDQRQQQARNPGQTHDRKLRPAANCIQ